MAAGLAPERSIVRYVNSWYAHALDSLDDLMRVFCILDGQPEPDYRSGFSTQFRDAKNAGQSKVETAYMDMVWYKNGNGHVTFKRPDLVREMNRILSLYYPFHIAKDNTNGAAR